MPKNMSKACGDYSSIANPTRLHATGVTSSVREFAASAALAAGIEVEFSGKDRSEVGRNTSNGEIIFKVTFLSAIGSGSPCRGLRKGQSNVRVGSINICRRPLQNDGRGGHRPKSNRRLVFDMGRRVLVTGSEGFTGRYVCQALANAGWEVWGSGVTADGSSSPYVRLDVLDPALIRKSLSIAQPDVVIHLAAVSFAAETDFNRYYNVNLLGTRNLLSG